MRTWRALPVRSNKESKNRKIKQDILWNGKKRLWIY